MIAKIIAGELTVSIWGPPQDPLGRIWSVRGVSRVVAGDTMEVAHHGLRGWGDAAPSRVQGPLAMLLSTALFLNERGDKKQFAI